MRCDDVYQQNVSTHERRHAVALERTLTLDTII
jgi:hypothetical protein